MDDCDRRTMNEHVLDSLERQSRLPTNKLPVHMGTAVRAQRHRKAVAAFHPSMPQLPKSTLLCFSCSTARTTCPLSACRCGAEGEQVLFRKDGSKRVRKFPLVPDRVDNTGAFGKRVTTRLLSDRDSADVELCGCSCRFVDAFHSRKLFIRADGTVELFCTYIHNSSPQAPCRKMVLPLRWETYGENWINGDRGTQRHKGGQRVYSRVDEDDRIPSALQNTVRCFYFSHK